MGEVELNMLLMDGKAMNGEWRDTGKAAMGPTAGTGTYSGVTIGFEC